MDNCNVFVMRASAGELPLLGRSAREYVEREFALEGYSHEDCLCGHAEEEMADATSGCACSSAEEKAAVTESPVSSKDSGKTCDRPSFCDDESEAAKEDKARGERRLRACGMEFHAEYCDVPSLMPGTVNIVIYSDMPLVGVELLAHYVRVMRRQGLRYLRLGGGAYISRGLAQDEGVSVKDDAFLRIGDAKSYNMVYNHLKERVIERHLAAGAYIYDAATTYIDDTVVIEPRAHILPMCRLEGATRVETGAVVAASYAQGSVIERGAKVEYSYLTDSLVHAGATVGPFARLRGAEIGAKCRIGDFVEVKASRLLGGVKAAHLAYIGDAEVGESTNVGCGTVFCNYDGKLKHPTKVGSGCFIGANANLVAPVTVGDGAYIAAGTTVTEDVPASHFAIGRSRQQTKRPRVERERDEKKEYDANDT